MPSAPNPCSTLLSYVVGNKPYLSIKNLPAQVVISAPSPCTNKIKTLKYMVGSKSFLRIKNLPAQVAPSKPNPSLHSVHVALSVLHLPQFVSSHTASTNTPFIQVLIWHNSYRYYHSHYNCKYYYFYQYKYN